MLRRRLLFSKAGRSKYLSHLDLMRTFQRAFIRAGIGIRHTEGFNPHPYLVFALPLPVGVESGCEMVDFDLLDESLAGGVAERLNRAMPEGITALSEYEPKTRFSAIKWLEMSGELIYGDAGAATAAAAELDELFGSKPLIINRRTKSGLSEFDVAPHIARIDFTPEGEGKVSVRAVVSAQEPAVSHEHLLAAISSRGGLAVPDFARFSRVEVYDGNLRVFR